VDQGEECDDGNTLDNATCDNAIVTSFDTALSPYTVTYNGQHTSTWSWSNAAASQMTGGHAFMTCGGYPNWKQDDHLTSPIYTRLGSCPVSLSFRSNFGCQNVHVNQKGYVNINVIGGPACAANPIVVSACGSGLVTRSNIETLCGLSPNAQFTVDFHYYKDNKYFPLDKGWRVDDISVTGAVQ
jgi:hypothetical protein